MLAPFLGSSIAQLDHGPSCLPLILLAPAATHSPCQRRPALRIRWDQMQDNTNEVAFASDSSCKEMRSQSSQPEGNEMQLNSSQAGEERRDMTEIGLTRLFCPQVWIYHCSTRWPPATG